MTYNILDGSLESLPAVIEIVNNEAPDFLCINEANTFYANDKAELKKFSHAVNMPFSALASSGKDDYHVAILSKHSLKSVQTITPLDRACVASVIDTPFGEIAVGSFHLTPYSEERRLKEITWILEYFHEFPRVILMGDFNALSPKDSYPEKFAETFNETQKKKFTVDGKVRMDVIQKVLENGYSDAAIAMGKNQEMTVPTPSNKDAAHAQMRLDYIFVSERLRPFLTEYTVIKNQLTDTASDHYPVCVTLR